MDRLELCKKVAGVLGWEIRIHFMAGYWLADGRGTTSDAVGSIPELSRILADPVERETDPKKIEKLCELFQQWELGSSFHGLHIFGIEGCKQMRDNLAAVLREGGKEAEPDKIIVQTIAEDWFGTTKKMIADHEAKYHAKPCPTCNGKGTV